MFAYNYKIYPIVHYEFYENWYIKRAKSFNWETTAKQYAEVYRTLLNR